MPTGPPTKYYARGFPHQSNNASQNVAISISGTNNHTIPWSTTSSSYMDQYFCDAMGMGENLRDESYHIGRHGRRRGVQDTSESVTVDDLPTNSQLASQITPRPRWGRKQDAPEVATEEHHTDSGRP